MQEWFEALTTFEKIFWYISVPFTLIFIIQLVLSIAGLDGRKLNKNTNNDGDNEVLKSEDQNKSEIKTQFTFGLSLFSIRNSIIFLMVFGWVGIFVFHKGLSEYITVLVSVLAGAITVLIFTLIFYLTQKAKKQF
jgi:hypothetical protein